MVYGKAMTTIRRDDDSQEIRPDHLSRVVPELYVRGFGYAVDGEEHGELAAGEAQFANVDVDEADGGLGDLASLSDTTLESLHIDRRVAASGRNLI